MNDSTVNGLFPVLLFAPVILLFTHVYFAAIHDVSVVQVRFEAETKGCEHVKYSNQVGRNLSSRKALHKIWEFCIKLHIHIHSGAVFESL